MANRRFGMGGVGGGGPQQRGGFVRNFSQPNSNVSPWQGGVAPGNTGNALQTQIALALSSLLQQNQPNQRPDHGPPSLLSMNTPSPTFFNPIQGGNFNNANRFNNNMNNRGRQDFRRNDNFNKNRAGWRSSDNNNRANNRGSGSNRNQRPNTQRSSTAKTQDSKDNKDKKQTPIDKTKPEKSDAPDTLVDEDVREDDKEEGDEDTKREWKKEKKGDGTDEMVDLTEEKGEDKDGKGKDKDGSKSAASKFDGLPRSFLHCFVCNKSMWDGESFQNHIRGKAHKQMIISLEDSFQSTVNILRENMRVAEERRVIEMQRMQRSRRFHHQNNNEVPSHCNMCNHKFLGKIVVHRQSRGHQRLKRFLHPNCKACNAEFPSRMEWVDHLFTSEHLIQAKKALDEKGEKAGEYKVEDVEYDILPIMEESMQNEDESPVLELSDDLSNLYNRIPAFKPGRDISTKSVSNATGFICDICNTFMITEEDSQNHLKSEVHYHRFVEAVKKKFMRENEKDKTKKRKSDEAAEGDEEEEDTDVKKEKNEEEEEEVEDENDTADETAKLKDEDDADMYDPFSSGAVKDDEEDEDSAEVEGKVANSTANADDSGAISLYTSAVESDTTVSANTTMDASNAEEKSDKQGPVLSNTATRGTGKARRGGGPPASTIRNGSPRNKRAKK